jgi:hypothetical protein
MIGSSIVGYVNAPNIYKFVIAFSIYLVLGGSIAVLSVLPGSLNTYFKSTASIFSFLLSFSSAI